MKIITNPVLAKMTTLKLGGCARALIQIEGEDDLDKLEKTLSRFDEPPFWIGRGSNLLAKDGDIPFVLVQMVSTKLPRIIARKNEKIEVEVEAGISLPRFLGFCLQNSLSGLQGLVGIPGSVGGAISMNAGSFGTETANCLSEVKVWVKGSEKVYNINELDVKYRKIGFPGLENNGFILSGKFTLTQGKKHDILEQMNHDFFQKKFKQPLEKATAGCVFKNPPSGPSAGLLLDNAGLRGLRLGKMEFSHKHANFLVNTGNGTAQEALELLHIAREKVKNQFDIDLEREVKIIPWD